MHKDQVPLCRAISFSDCVKLLAAAREAGIPVFHLTGLLDSDSGIINWSDAVHVADGPRPKPTDGASLDRHRRRYDIVDELAPIPGEGVLRKAASSGFWGTPLAFELNRRGIDTLIIAGESTSGCVRATVVDACTFRFRITIPQECVFDRHEATHAINLFDMHQKYADVRPLSEVLEYISNWQRESEAARPEARPRRR